MQNQYFRQPECSLLSPTLLANHKYQLYMLKKYTVSCIKIFQTDIHITVIFCITIHNYLLHFAALSLYCQSLNIAYTTGAVTYCNPSR